MIRRKRYPITAVGSWCAARHQTMPGTAGEHAEPHDGLPTAGQTKARGRKPSGAVRVFGIQQSRMTADEPPRLAPSPIRTLPSAPEFHRIMLVDTPLARGLYRRSGLGRHSSRPHQTPKAATERIAMDRVHVKTDK